jgi:AmmeMemoRadiSam system protein B
MIRKAVAAGRYYPESASEIREMMATFVDKTATKEAVIGLLMPHAGYPYSGPVAGATISRVSLTDSFIIIGPSHTGMGKPFGIMTEGKWQTPLGEVEIDSVLGKKLLDSSKYLEEDDEAHLYEHCIEVQLPFLQYIKPDFKLVPIVFGYPDGAIYKEIGHEIARVIKELGKEVVIIASSDMSHYEPQPLTQEKDSQAIEAMLKLDEDELSSRVAELNITMCGYAPAVSLIVAAKELGATSAELVKYQTSGDVTGDYSAVVGYAGIIIKGGGK